MRNEYDLVKTHSFDKAIAERLAARTTKELEESRATVLSLEEISQKAEARNAELVAEVASLRVKVEEKDHVLHTLQTGLVAEAAALNALVSKVNASQQTEEPSVKTGALTADEADQLRAELEIAQKQKAVVEGDFEYLHQQYNAASDAAASLGRDNANLQVDIDSARSQAKYGVQQARLHFESEIARLKSELEHERGSMSILLEKSARLDRTRRSPPEATYLKAEVQGLRATFARLAHEVLPEDCQGFDAHDIVNTVIDNMGEQLTLVNQLSLALSNAVKERDTARRRLQEQDDDGSSPPAQDLHDWLQSDVLEPSEASPITRRFSDNGQNDLPRSSSPVHRTRHTDRASTEPTDQYMYVCIWHAPGGKRCDAEFQHKKVRVSISIGEEIHIETDP